MAKKVEKSESELCLEHRKKLKLNTELDIGTFKCRERSNNALLCWKECPVPSRIKEGQRQVTLPDGQPLPIVAPTKVADFMEQLGKDVYGDSPKKDGVDDAKPKQKQIPRAVEDFLTMQAHVISKLAWRPEIWEALYNLSGDEILDRLIGKTGLEGVPTIVGGKQPFAVSNKTKKMFEDMEKKLEGEGAVPYDATKDEPDNLMVWTDNYPSPRNLPKGYFKKLMRKDANFDERLKICQEQRKKNKKDNDFMVIDCDCCLTFEGCPIWAKKEDKTT